MRSPRFGLLLVVFALVVAACGGGEADVVSADDPAPATSQPAAPIAESTAETTPSTSPTTESGEESDTEATRPAPDPNRTIAPDFSLNLGDGSTFVLSEETRPVFMVFWAEW